MSDFSPTDEQLQRLDAVCDDLENVYLGPYGSISLEDALDYLLDTYSPPEDGADGLESETAETAIATDATESTDADGSELQWELTDIDGVGAVKADALEEAGFPSVAAIRDADPTALTDADGIGEAQAIDIKAEATELPDEPPNATGDAANGNHSDRSSSDIDSAASENPADDTPENTLQKAMSLLESHDDRWREASGDEPYEVDLPDGSTESVRTKDGVKRLIFKHWK